MVSVQFFAALKDVTGLSSVEVPLTKRITTAELYDTLTAEHPGLARFRSIVLVAVNEEYSDWEAKIGPEDQVAFFPPVSGGRK